MRVLGIDPGTATLGFGLIDSQDDGLISIDFGVLSTPKQLTIAERLKLLHDGISRLIRRHKPQELAVEELFVTRKLRTAMMVGQSRGVVLLAAAQRGIPVYEYAPARVKQVVTGYGRGRKEQVTEMVRIHLGLPTTPKPDDAADALAVAICHIRTAGFNRLVGNSP